MNCGKRLTPTRHLRAKDSWPPTFQTWQASRCRFSCGASSIGQTQSLWSFSTGRTRNWRSTRCGSPCELLRSSHLRCSGKRDGGRASLGGRFGDMTPNKTLDRMTRSAVSRVFQCGRPCRAPRHRSAAERGLVLTQPCLSRQVFYGSRRLAGGAGHCQGSGASQTMQSTWEPQSGATLESDGMVKTFRPQ